MRALNKVQVLSIDYEQYVKKNKRVTGEMIGPYQLLGQIGSGSFGSVYRAQHTESQQTFAVKILDLKELRKQQNPKTYEIKMRLSRTEAELMQVCNSQNLVKCFQVFENEDLKALVITFCNGEDLNQLVRKKKKIPENEAIPILKQIINGLAELHKHKIIHRDLKPENIISHDGVFKIADFGFSKELRLDKNEEKGTVLGTYSTMAPEVLNRQPYGLKADIWSIGIIFYFMLFGVYPYSSCLDEEKRMKEIKGNKFLTEEKQISPNAIKFIRETLVATSQGRLDWNELKSHLIFQEREGKLAKNFQLDIDINIPKLAKSDYAEDLEGNGPVYLLKSIPNAPQQESAFQKITPQQESGFQKIAHWAEKQQLNSKIEATKEQQKRLADQALLQTQQRREKQRALERKKFSESAKKSAQYAEKEISPQTANQNFRLYYWAKEAHWECLKTEVIFTEIISKIKERQLISLQNRREVEMMYLISTRCLNNMSDINHQYEKHKDNVSVRSLNNQVKHLYGKVVHNWRIFSQQVTDHENRFFSGITSDFFKKVFSKDQIKRKDNFLTGIQVQNYTKDEQIEYTYVKYILPVLQTIKESSKEQRNLRKHMYAYQKICKLSGRDHGFGYFDEAVSKILSESETRLRAEKQE